VARNSLQFIILRRVTTEFHGMAQGKLNKRSTMNRHIILSLFTIVIVALLEFSTVGIALADIAPPSHTPKVKDPVSPSGAIFRTDCAQDSDCISGVEFHPSCLHYCIGTECKQAHLCPAFRRDTSARLPDCARNAPCRKASSIHCLNGECTSEEYKSAHSQ
jgi:hypothetical protein